MRALAGLLLAGCASTLPAGARERIAPDAAIAEGHRLAVACMGTAPRVPFHRLRFWVDRSTDRADYGRGVDAVVQDRLRGEPRIWGHVLLHLLYRLPGSTPDGVPHPAVFAACGLDERAF